MNVSTQNDLLMTNLMCFYTDENIRRMTNIINGESRISLRIIDWFVTNFAKKYYIVYNCNKKRFKVHNDYKLKLKAYSKRRFDTFCRWERVSIPITDTDHCIETTIGQMNFFKWAIENEILDYIETYFDVIEADMNSRNSSTKRLSHSTASTASTLSSVESINDVYEGVGGSGSGSGSGSGKTRKKREELSISACKCIKKENIHVIMNFH